ncbi:MAG TPA: PilN domain-containing protein [Solirubrobacterales bacterium]|jgi:Tfp pilus assembly protein PilN|nr:PilN domain-containing protein [Solirubrobacterales bacterium]
MRPVNLIPPEEQRGDRAPMRTGGASYVLIGALALGLLLVVATAITSKQISDRKTDRQVLEQELQAATARAESLRAFADFRGVQESRTATISSLAKSRFDWERVMRELSRVIPPDVWLVNLTGTASPAVQIQDAAEIVSRDTVPGPALEIIGCAPSQDSVAGFVAALEDIDGVTRVGVQSSQRSEQEASGPPAASSSAQSTTEECRTRSFIYKFEIVVAFDAVPDPATATQAPTVPSGAAPADAQLAGSQPAGGNSVGEQTSQAQQAANLVPGG